MALKKFNATLVQTLNGIDTYAFDHVCHTASVATRYGESATIEINVNGQFAFGGTVKTVTSKKSGFVQSILCESPLAKLRDHDLQEESSRGLSKVSKLLADVVPAGISIRYTATIDPPITYAFRSGSVLTHLNTMCALNGLNWRGKTSTATEMEITISDRGEENPDVLELIENVNIFNLSLDKSMFKKYTKVTAIGVENEISGYTCTASLQTPTYFILDSDDGELGEDEVPVVGYEYEYLYPSARYSRIIISYGAELKGWDLNDHIYINSEAVRFSSKSGNTLLGCQRSQWNTLAEDHHVIGDCCALARTLSITMPNGVTPASISPATTLFRIGSEIVQATEVTGTALLLATVNATTWIQEGRGLFYDTENLMWRSDVENIYPHKRGTPITPYYTDTASYDPESSDEVLAVTVHGKGIITKDGIDKLAWGVLTNLQNGILSGKCTYKAGDFGDTNITVGQKMRITTASAKTSATSIISPATTYDALIYSITRKQNKLMEIEFGNVIPEVLNMLKSGEYALQAAVRKTPAFDTKSVQTLSVTGKTARRYNGSVVELRW